MFRKLRKKDISIIAAECGKFLWYLYLATFMGGLIGSLAGGISCGISEGEPIFGAMYGIVVGSFVSFLFYTVAHWFVFRIPLERVAKFLIGGTLIGSLPLALIPKVPPLCLFGGVVGYWSGLVILLMRRWREKRAEQMTGENGNS